jgi:hypothetical protein
MTRANSDRKRLVISKPEKKVDLEKKAWKIFSLYVRLRDAQETTGGTQFCKCITCERVKPFEDMDAGHCFSRTCKDIIFDTRNVSGQCRGCNGRRENRGEQFAHKKAIREKYGQKVLEELEYRSKKMKQWREPELLEVIARFTALVRESWPEKIK